VEYNKWKVEERTEGSASAVLAQEKGI